jgi:hypothetical protein
MSQAALSVFVFGIYLAAGGVLLVFVPERLCSFLGLRPPGDTIWVRLTGMFFLDVAFYCIKAARSEQKDFFRWSVMTRPFTLPLLAAVVGYGLENPLVLFFGMVDVLAALWTGLALRGQRSHEGTAKAEAETIRANRCAP